MKYEFTMQQLVEMTDQELLRNYTLAHYYYDNEDVNHVLSNLRNAVLNRMQRFTGLYDNR